jgi:hypothetical protein
LHEKALKHDLDIEAMLTVWDQSYQPKS